VITMDCPPAPDHFDGARMTSRNGTFVFDPTQHPRRCLPVSLSCQSAARWCSWQRGRLEAGGDLAQEEVRTEHSPGCRGRAFPSLDLPRQPVFFMVGRLTFPLSRTFFDIPIKGPISRNLGRLTCPRRSPPPPQASTRRPVQLPRPRGRYGTLKTPLCIRVPINPYYALAVPHLVPGR